MAFFSEVKAKLGLDISEFERELSAAVQDAKRAEKDIERAKQNRIDEGRRAFYKGLQDEDSARKKSLERADRGFKTLAAAAGINMQDIAQVIARFFTGFSKDAEEQLNNLITKTEEAARKQEAALAAAQRKREQMEADLAKRNEERRVSRLSGEQRENELIAERDRLRGVADGKGTRAIEASLRLLDIEEELKEIVKDRIAAAVAENAEKQKERDEAQRERDEQAKWLDDILTKTEQDIAKAEQDRLDTLKKQNEQLENQQATIKETLAEYAKAQRRSLLPTTDEVRSGSRRIGPAARRQVRELDRSQARVRALSDAEQRKLEEFNNSTSEADRRRFQEEGRKIRSEKEAELGRSESLKKGLEGRVSDIDTNKASLEKLGEIEKGIADLNTKLESTSV